GRLQGWLDHHHLGSVHVEKDGRKFLDQVGTKDVQKYTTKALHWAEGAGLTVVTLLFEAILLVVVSIYMLLDMQRLTELVDRRFHPLLVLFGLLAGGEIYGFAGILVALPLLAAGRAAWEFFAERISLEKWPVAAPLVDIGLEPPGGDKPPPETPPAPAA